MFLEELNNITFLQIILVAKTVKNKCVSSHTGSSFVKSSDRPIGPNFEYCKIDDKEPSVKYIEPDHDESFSSVVSNNITILTAHFFEHVFLIS